MCFVCHRIRCTTGSKRIAGGSVVSSQSIGVLCPIGNSEINYSTHTQYTHFNSYTIVRTSALTKHYGYTIPKNPFWTRLTSNACTFSKSFDRNRVITYILSQPPPSSSSSLPLSYWNEEMQVAKWRCSVQFHKIYVYTIYSRMLNSETVKNGKRTNHLKSPWDDANNNATTRSRVCNCYAVSQFIHVAMKPKRKNLEKFLFAIDYY